MYQQIAETLVRIDQVPDVFWYSAMAAVILLATFLQVRESRFKRAQVEA